MAFFKAVSVILFSAGVKTFGVASEFSSNLLSSLSEVSSHGSLSSFVSSLSLLKFNFGSFEKFRISSLKVVNISIIFISKSLFLSSWEFGPVGGASGFIFNTLGHGGMSLFIELSRKNVSINTLSSNFLVACTTHGELIEESNMILSDWFVVFSEDDVFSNFVRCISVGKGFNRCFIISFLSSLLSNSISFNITLNGINFINVPGNGWESNLSGRSGGNEGSNGSKFHILNFLVLFN